MASSGPLRFRRSIATNAFATQSNRLNSCTAIPTNSALFFYHYYLSTIVARVKVTTHLRPRSTMSTNRAEGWDQRTVGIGGTAIVSLYDEDETTILKGYILVLSGKVAYGTENEERQKRSFDLDHEVCERLGPHPNILPCLGWVPNTFSPLRVCIRRQPSRFH
jgi:hypothetical protein